MSFPEKRGPRRLTRLDLNVLRLERRHKDLSGFLGEGFAGKSVEAARPVYAAVAGGDEFLGRSIVEARGGKLGGGEDFGGRRDGDSVGVGVEAG